MKFRKKGPIEVKIQSKQGETFTFQFDLIDFVPSFYGIRGVDGLAINLGDDLVFGITIAIGVFEITDR